METALVPAKVITNHSIPAYLSAGRQWQGIPSLEKTAGGRIFVCWYSGGATEEPGNVIIREKSDDGGESFTDGLVLVRHDDPAVRCFDPALWIDPEGRFWLSGPNRKILSTGERASGRPAATIRTAGSFSLQNPAG